MLKLEAVLGEYSPQRRHQCQKVSDQSENGMCRLVVAFSESIFVEKDAGLGNGDDDEGRCLKNPVNCHAVFIVESLSHEVVVCHSQDCMRHQKQIL